MHYSKICIKKLNLAKEKDSYRKTFTENLEEKENYSYSTEKENCFAEKLFDSCSKINGGKN